MFALANTLRKYKHYIIGLMFLQVYTGFYIYSS
jgi:hypothetical protein